jgi:hypothetical protein
MSLFTDQNGKNDQWMGSLAWLAKMVDLTKHIDWLREKIVNTPYVCHDDDPLMCVILEMELRRRNIPLSIDEVNTIVNLKRSISHHLGDFWQRILGDAPGWENLGVGDTTGCDIKNEEKKIIIELKNKINTMNSSSKSAVMSKLQKQQAGGYTAVLGIINDKKGKMVSDKTTGVTVATGDQLLTMVYGYNIFDDVMAAVRTLWIKEPSIDDLAAEFMGKAMVNE